MQGPACAGGSRRNALLQARRVEQTLCPAASAFSLTQRIRDQKLPLTATLQRPGPPTYSVTPRAGWHPFPTPGLGSAAEQTRKAPCLLGAYLLETRRRCAETQGVVQRGLV